MLLPWLITHLQLNIVQRKNTMVFKENHYIFKNYSSDEKTQVITYSGLSTADHHNFVEDKHVSGKTDENKLLR